MENATFVPTNFRISRQAQAMLNEVTAEASAETGRAMVPALFWDEEYDEITKQIVARGIALGYYYLDEMPARLLQTVDGITLIFAVSPEQALHFNGKEIDYRKGRRFFLVSCRLIQQPGDRAFEHRGRLQDVGTGKGANEMVRGNTVTVHSTPAASPRVSRLENALRPALDGIEEFPAAEQPADGLGAAQPRDRDHLVHCHRNLSYLRVL